MIGRASIPRHVVRAGGCTLLVALSLAAAPATAQPEPRGPADIVSNARKARDAREIKEAGQRAAGAQPSGAQAAEQPPTPSPAAAAAPDAGTADEGATAGDPHHGAAQPGTPPKLAEEQANTALPDGTIRVHVTDLSKQPVNAADIELAIMASDNTRTTRTAKTGSDGVTSFTGLSGGDKQAYRVNVRHEGAKYSSNPFRLPLSGGYDVNIVQLPVTRSERMVIMYVGATSVELKDDRLKVVQQTRLMNVGSETYVFPDEGTLIKLPEGFLAFQTQESMTDQHVTEAKGEGLRVRGSLPPGEATILWAFDLPIPGSTAKFGIDLPWLVFTYRVITDAPSGMSVKVEGMPEPELHKDEGRRYWVTEMQRKVGDQPFKRVEITITGIPGLGSARWIATVLALLAIAAGILFARRLPDTRAARTGADFEAHKADVLQRARALKEQHEAGETGPEYHREQLAALTDELAELLYEQAELKKAQPSARSARA